MKKLILLALLSLFAASGAGCSSCNRPVSSCMSWFRRGDRCAAPDTCPPGGVTARMVAPGTIMGPGADIGAGGEVLPLPQ